MTTPNKALLEKADIALSDLSANGGLLLPEQANTFIRKLIQSPTMIRVARVTTMVSPQRKINKIVFGSRILQPAVSATALTEDQRSKPTTEQVELNTNEVIAEVDIPYDVMEDNIERAATADNGPTNTGPGGLRDTIIALIAERAALDLEELGLLGDTTSSDDYLAINDGWLKLASEGGNVVDYGGAAVSKTLFKQGLLSLPVQYRRNVGSLNHFISRGNVIEYQDSLSNRIGAMGDQNVTQANPTTTAYGSPVMGVDLMPATQGLLTNPLNLIMGIHRDISGFLH